MTSTNGYQTSEQWQLNETGLAILPIGAMEQHGAHMPLLTDTIQAEYFAEYLANELKAMLLPAIPFGTSLEHKGFRGSISLMPDVLMALVSNISDELEMQNVTRLIIVNGHGGNFSLGPIVRKINRQDKKIKIILSNFWVHHHCPTKHPEVHAGEDETSIMLAIAQEKKSPQWVNHLGVAENPCYQNPPFEQSDLNTFGVGRMSETGVWGDPTLATVQKGKKMLSQIKKNFLQFVQTRLSLLEQDARYGGPGPVALRLFTKADIPLGMKLKTLASWNQLPSDWHLFLNNSLGGNFVALHNGQKCGTVTTVTYDKKISWIGMVLVDPQKRRCGIGTKLLQKAIAYAEKKGSVYLDATPEGKKLYDTIGFKDIANLSRMQKKFSATNDKHQTGTLKSKKMSPSDMKNLKNYDTKIFGANRASLLEGLQQNAKEYAFVYDDNKKILGYCLGRHGENFEQIGPIVADNEVIAKDLFFSALKQTKKKPIIIDTFDQNESWLQFLEEQGFTLQRPFIRMVKGKNSLKSQFQKQFAITGPELG